MKRNILRALLPGPLLTFSDRLAAPVSKATSRVSSRGGSERLDGSRGRIRAFGRAAALILSAALLAMPVSRAARAGGIAYTFSLAGSQFSMTLKGDAPAYYPSAYRLGEGGVWVAMQPLQSLAEQTRGVSARFRWPVQGSAAIDLLKGFMVRFFDVTGVGFGQVAFFAAPPLAAKTIGAAYVDGRLRLRPPDAAAQIRATWVIAPYEAGIAPIAKPLSFAPHPQPPARRIDWTRRHAPVLLDLGAGEPRAVLIHETAAGFRLQDVPGGRLLPGGPGIEQRTRWLKSAALFYRLAAALLVAGVTCAVFALIRGRRAGKKA